MEELYFLVAPSAMQIAFPGATANGPMAVKVVIEGGNPDSPGSIGNVRVRGQDDKVEYFLQHHVGLWWVSESKYRELLLLKGVDEDEADGVIAEAVAYLERMPYLT